MKQLQMIVTGKVQDVGFRYFTQRKAIQYGIHGWVKNRSDGNVEIVASGEQENLKSFIQDIHIGNPFSKVDTVEINEIKISNPLQ